MGKMENINSSISVKDIEFVVLKSNLKEEISNFIVDKSGNMTLTK